MGAVQDKLLVSTMSMMMASRLLYKTNGLGRDTTMVTGLMTKIHIGIGDAVICTTPIMETISMLTIPSSFTSGVTTTIGDTVMADIEAVMADIAVVMADIEAVTADIAAVMVDMAAVIAAAVEDITAVVADTMVAVVVIITRKTL